MESNYRDSSKNLPLRKRSHFRIYIAKRILRNLRFLKWFVNSKKIAKTQINESYDNIVYEHSSTLIRPLKGLDLQLQYNKITNLQLAIDRINNLIIPPNKMFSFWFLVGNPSKKNGFKKGMVLQNGKVIADYGGGMCQLTNLLYWMIIHTPLTVTERYRHSYDVFPDLNRKLPFGSGATVSYNYIDFQFFNSTTDTYQLKFWLTENKLFGQILCNQKINLTYRIFEADHKIVKEALGGYSRHNKIFRETFKDNNLIKKELLAENHALMMYNPLLENRN